MPIPTAMVRIDLEQVTTYGAYRGELSIEGTPVALSFTLEIDRTRWSEIVGEETAISAVMRKACFYQRGQRIKKKFSDLYKSFDQALAIAVTLLINKNDRTAATKATFRVPYMEKGTDADFDDPKKFMEFVLAINPP